MSSIDKQKITGYRQLSDKEVGLINEIKQKGVELGELVEKLQSSDNIDGRWVSIGKTDLQTGIMALVRSVAKPTSF